jgi:AraC family transcriptional regulator
MFSRIETTSEKKMVGMRVRMSFANVKTFEIWQRFQPRRKEIHNIINKNLYSLEVYDDETFFVHFDPTKSFYKWAAVEVSDFESVPHEMETLTIPAGLYAVFIHQGVQSEGEQTYRYIFETWLPKSEFVLDHQPHFAVMGESYKPNDPSSIEEIWVPVKKR